MHKKFEVNRTKIKGGCQSCRKVVAHDSRSDLPLDVYQILANNTPGLLFGTGYLLKINKRACPRGKSLLESWATTFLHD